MLPPNKGAEPARLCHRLLTSTPPHLCIIGLKQVSLQRRFQQLRGIGCPEFLHHIGAMGIGRLHADLQMRGNTAIGLSFPDQPENLQLARREIVGPALTVFRYGFSGLCRISLRRLHTRPLYIARSIVIHVD